MSAFLQGMMDWNLQSDPDGHRSYKVKWLVGTTDFDDGPMQASLCPELPAIGAPWVFGNDNDPFAFCWPDWIINPVLTNEPNQYYTVEQTFTTKPLRRCQDTSINNPLSEPPNISGGNVKFTRQAVLDAYGNPFVTSSHELITGPEAERDDNRHNVQIEMNLAYLPIGEFVPMLDAINAFPMWGLAAHMVKLSSVNWQRLLFGTCSFYFKVSYGFEINPLTWIRYIADMGTMKLGPGGDPADQSDFIPIIEHGERTTKFLNGGGVPLASGEDPVILEKHVYPEVNLLNLGIPDSFIA